MGFAAALAPVLIMVLAGAPDMARAGVLSFFEELRGKNVEAQERAADVQYVQNSQTMALLHAARHVDPNPAKGGGEIQVEDGEALRAETGPLGSLVDVEEERRSPDEISLYIVREGDTLSQIAQMFEVSPNTVRWANDLGREEAIHAGQQLVILPVTGVQHTVVEGDTLKSIAEEYDGDVDEILQFNGLTEDAVLSVGDTLTIPGGEIAAPAPAQSSSESYAAAPVRGASGPAIAGYYAHPAPGSRRTQGLHGYNGVDFGADVGTRVLASAAGRVIVSRASGWNGGYGTYIVVDHANGTQTLYAHLSSTIVRQGQNVVQGQVIGYIGNTGRTTGPHLHFEVRGAKNPF